MTPNNNEHSPPKINPVLIRCGISLSSYLSWKSFVEVFSVFCFRVQRTVLPQMSFRGAYFTLEVWTPITQT